MDAELCSPSPVSAPFDDRHRRFEPNGEAQRQSFESGNAPTAGGRLRELPSISGPSGVAHRPRRAPSSGKRPRSAGNAGRPLTSRKPSTSANRPVRSRYARSEIVVPSVRAPGSWQRETRDISPPVARACHSRGVEQRRLSRALTHHLARRADPLDGADALGGVKLVEDVGVGVERHLRRVARLACDLDDVVALGD